MLEITKAAVGNAAVLCGADSISPYSEAAASTGFSTNDLIQSVRTVSRSYIYRIHLGERAMERANS